MKQFRWLAAGMLGALVTVLIGYRVEGARGTLTEWLFHFPRYGSYAELPSYSVHYWAAAGFIIGVLWIVVRDRD